MRAFVSAILLLGCRPFATGSVAAEERDDPTRPVTTIDLRPHYEDHSFESGNDRLSLIARRNDKWDLDAGWILGTRVDVPATLSMESKDQARTYHAGLGRVLVAAYGAHALDERWAFAAGSQLVMPASSSALGRGNWDLVPLMAARYLLPGMPEESYFLAEMRYAVSIGRSFGSRPSSELQFAPQLKMAIAPQWFVVLFPSPDIRMNFGGKVDGQMGRLFLPLDGEVGWNLTEATVASLEVSAPVIKNYPVYRLKIQARISVKL